MQFYFENIDLSAGNIFRCVKSNLNGDSFEQYGIDEKEKEKKKKNTKQNNRNGKKLVIICHPEYLHEND